MGLPIELNNKIVEFLKSLPNIHDSNSQRVLILSTGIDAELQNQIHFSGPPSQFFQLLLPTLMSYGKLKDGRDALEAVLGAAKSSVGQEKKACDDFIQKLRTLRNKYRFTETVLEKLPEKPLNLPEFDSTRELEEKFEELNRERILVISCLDEKILLSAAYAMVEKFDKM